MDMSGNLENEWKKDEKQYVCRIHLRAIYIAKCQIWRIGGNKDNEVICFVGYA